MENVYIRSKFEAECEILQAIPDGQRANIIRVGNLTNRFSDTKFQRNYTESAFLTRVKAALEFGMVPDYLLPLDTEFSMVDSTAEAVIKIAEHFNDKFYVFHANNNKKIRFEKLLENLSKLSINIKAVCGVEISKLEESNKKFDLSDHIKKVYEIKNFERQKHKFESLELDLEDILIGISYIFQRDFADILK